MDTIEVTEARIEMIVWFQKMLEDGMENWEILEVLEHEDFNLSLQMDSLSTE